MWNFSFLNVATTSQLKRQICIVMQSGHSRYAHAHVCTCTHIRVHKSFHGGRREKSSFIDLLRQIRLQRHLRRAWSSLFDVNYSNSQRMISTRNRYPLSYGSGVSCESTLSYTSPVALFRFCARVHMHAHAHTCARVVQRKKKIEIVFRRFAQIDLASIVESFSFSHPRKMDRRFTSSLYFWIV